VQTSHDTDQKCCTVILNTRLTSFPFENYLHQGCPTFMTRGPSVQVSN